MDRFNYCTHAVESIRTTASILKTGNIAEDYIETANKIEDAVKFILPQNGRIFDVNYDEINPLEHFNLPFQAVALEFPIEQKPSVQGISAACSKRIALCEQHESADALIDSFFRRESDFSKKELRKILSSYEKFITLLPINYVDSKDEWTINPCFVIFTDKSKITSVSNSANWGISDVLYFPAGELGNFHYDKGYSRESMQIDTSDEANAFFHFMVCLNCNNVSVKKDPVPAPVKLNRARKKRNKTPFFDYHVLTVKVKTPQNKTENSQSTDRKVREHTRRGHPRRLPSGKTTWVRPSVVNAGKGDFLDKDYRLLF